MEYEPSNIISFNDSKVGAGVKPTPKANPINGAKVDIGSKINPPTKRMKFRLIQAINIYQRLIKRQIIVG